MVTYRFKVSFEDFDEVVREIDIKTSQTFADLHQAIHKSTGYNSERSSSFFVSTDNWLKGDEIAFMPSERKTGRNVVLMENSRLKNFIEDPHQKFYYTYDFDRPFDFHVELIKINIDADENVEYPHLVKSVGDAPKIIDKASIGKVAVTTSEDSEFDFLNELNFVPEDAEELESMAGRGINEEEKSESDEDEDEAQEFEGDEEMEEGDFGSEKNEDY